MGVVDWMCRTLCSKRIAAERERVMQEQEETVEQLKAEAAKQTNPVKVIRHAAERLARMGMVLAFFGCHQLTPQQQERARVFECRVAAISSVAEGVLEPESLVRDIVLGKVNPTQALLAAGATAGELIEVAKAWNACTPAAAPIEGS